MDQALKSSLQVQPSPVGSDLQPTPDDRRYAVLIADDSEADRFLLRHALRAHPRLTVVGEVEDGAETINYLSGTEPFQDRTRHPYPDVLILDLQMPCKTGFEVLEWMGQQTKPPLATVVVSASTLPEDEEKCLALGAYAYHTKPANRQGRDDMLRSIELMLESRGLH